MRVDGAVADVPVQGEAEPAEERLEGLLVLDGEHVAQLDEVAPADRLLIRELGTLALAGPVTVLWRNEALDVRLGCLTANAVVVLHPTLGGQAVVVPTDGVEDLETRH